MKNLVKFMRYNALLFIIVICLMSIFISTSAHAVATAASESLIDWSSLVITLDPGVSLTWTEQGNWSEAWAYYNGVQMDNQASGSNDWGDTFAAAAFSTANGQASGTAFTTASTLKSSVSAFSDTGGRFDASAAGWGENRWGRFDVSGTGNVTFSVDYSMFLTLNETQSRPFDITTANPSAELMLRNLTTSNELPAFEENWYPEWNPPLNGTLNKAGTMSVTMGFADGEQGYMRSGVGSGVWVKSVAPEPISSILFVTGGALLAGRRFIRRKT